MIRSVSVAVLVCGASSLAQPAITIEVENPVLLPGESTVVRLWAGFDPSDYAMAGVATNFITSVGSEGWSDAMRVAPMNGPGTSAGVASPTGFDDIVAGQLQFPRHGYYADSSNPIAFWSVTYTAPIDLASPFIVDLSTAARRYDVYPAMWSERAESRLAGLTEGSATIRVIPAPASGLVLACGIFAMRRRR